MDIIKLLELSINDITMSYELFNTLGRAGYFRISDILFAGKDRIKCVKSLGIGRYCELKTILMNYEIDLDDNAACMKLIQVYKRLKMKQLGESAVDILGYPIEKVCKDVVMSDFLRNNGYDCIYDVLSQKPQILIKTLSCSSTYLKEWGNSYYYVELMRNIFRYGIDITDREQCCRLNREYRIKRSLKLRESLDFKNNANIVRLSLQLELLTSDSETINGTFGQLQSGDFVQNINDISIDSSDFSEGKRIK